MQAFQAATAQFPCRILPLAGSYLPLRYTIGCTILGHGSLDTTKIYLRLVPERLKEDYDRAMPEIATGLEKP
jgi:hypothetical protein